MKVNRIVGLTISELVLEHDRKRVKQVRFISHRGVPGFHDVTKIYIKTIVCIRCGERLLVKPCLEEHTRALKNECNSLVEKIDTLHETQEDLDTSIKTKKQAVKELTLDIEQKTAEKTEVYREREEASQVVKNLKESIGVLKAEKLSLQKRIEDEQASAVRFITNAEIKKTKLNQQIKQLNTQKRGVEEEIKDATKQKEALDKQIENLHLDIKTLTKESADLKKQTTESTNHIATLKVEAEELQENMEKKLEEHSNKMTEEKEALEEDQTYIANAKMVLMRKEKNVVYLIGEVKKAISEATVLDTLDTKSKARLKTILSSVNKL